MGYVCFRRRISFSRRRSEDAQTKCDSGHDTDDRDPILFGVSGAVVQRLDDPACGCGNGGDAGACRIVFQPGGDGCRRKCHALRQPFCFRGTGKILRLSGADPAECGAVLSAALGAGVGWHFRFCRAAEPSVPAKHSDGAGSAAYGAPAAAGEHQRLSERIFQCRVPCDSDSRL